MAEKKLDRKMIIIGAANIQTALMLFIDKLEETEQQLKDLFEYIENDKAANKAYHLWMQDKRHIKDTSEDLKNDLDDLRERLSKKDKTAQNADERKDK